MFCKIVQVFYADLQNGQTGLNMASNGGATRSSVTYDHSQVWSEMPPI